MREWRPNMEQKDNWPNAGLNESQAGIKIAGRNINNLRHADDTTLMAERSFLKGQNYRAGEVSGCQEPQRLTMQ